MPDHPTLLRHPDSDRPGQHIEEILPGTPWDYGVFQQGNNWVVRDVLLGVIIYRGPGPVELFRSNAPF